MWPACTGITWRSYRWRARWAWRRPVIRITWEESKRGGAEFRAVESNRRAAGTRKAAVAAPFHHHRPGGGPCRGRAPVLVALDVLRRHGRRFGGRPSCADQRAHQRTCGEGQRGPEPVCRGGHAAGGDRSQRLSDGGESGAGEPGGGDCELRGPAGERAG